MRKLFVLIAAWALVLGTLAGCGGDQSAPAPEKGDRKSTRLNSSHIH